LRIRPSHDLFGEEQSLPHQLQQKSRRRRKELLQLAEAIAAPGARRNDPLPRLDLVSIRLDDLNLPKRKTRKCTPAHVREVMGAISALGFCAPILVGRDNLVLDGEIRVGAARALGLAAVPCIRIDHLTDVEQRTLRLAVNRLGEKGEWDLTELKIEFEELILAEAPIEISGFTLEEIDQIVLGDEAEEAEQEPLARLGDIFRLGEHRIICGDATGPAVVAKLMENPPPAAS
jgi:ParB-like nuclease domain